MPEYIASIKGVELDIAIIKKALDAVPEVESVTIMDVL